MLPIIISYVWVCVFILNTSYSSYPIVGIKNWSICVLCICECVHSTREGYRRSEIETIKHINQIINSHPPTLHDNCTIYTHLTGYSTQRRIHFLFVSSCDWNIGCITTVAMGIHIKSVYRVVYKDIVCVCLCLCVCSFFVVVATKPISNRVSTIYVSALCL